MCLEEIKSIAVLLNLLHCFYHGIQCVKTCNSVHGEKFGVHVCRFKVWSFKDTHNLVQIFTYRQTFAICHQIYVFDENVFFVDYEIVNVNF